MLRPFFIFSTFLSLAFLPGCDPDPSTPKPAPTPSEVAVGKPGGTFQTFTIPTKAHESNTGNLNVFAATVLRFRAVFDSSAVYQSRQAVNQHDINKLYGFSDCGTHHHQNSARFGWNWQDDALRIYAYVYANGQRTVQTITTVKLEETNEYQISIGPQGYVFTVNGKHATRMAGGCPGSSFRYRLYPYFGGDETAPHPIRIRIMDLDQDLQH